MTHYDVLGVSESASTAEIRRAYRALARRYHPDVVGSGPSRARQEAERRMAAINLAWSVLGDAEKRRRYDRELHRGRESPSHRPGSARVSWVPGRPHPGFVPFDFDDEPDVGGPVVLDDDPIHGGRPVPRWIQVLPVGFLAVSLASFALYVVTSLRVLLGVGGVSFGLATVSFLVAPMVAMMRSSPPRG
ncbi:MAG: J domain-containing protein [Acidimicrobiales bacterium]|nr:J domain-containing protein [Acidimicrobiales bacterium]